VTVQTGQAITNTEPWVTLNFEDVIEVPEDAWAEWDATDQEFVPASVIYPDGKTALVKSVVTYPTDLFTAVTWHDGSPLTIGDFIYNMILSEDRSDPESSIYDENSSNFIFDENTIVGIRIINQNPLTIETYHNQVELDAELLVCSWWPNQTYGPAPWHTTALAAVAEEAGDLAFSESKANTLGVPWANFLHGDTLGILSANLANFNIADYIPYANTLENYITPQEADQRWINLDGWFASKGHFWVGSGPFYVDEYDWNAQTLTLSRFENFPDPSDKWEQFQEGSIHALAIDYPYGAPGSTFVILGQYYPPNTEAEVYINEELVGTVLTDANGEFSLTLTMDPDSEFGFYIIKVTTEEQVERVQSDSVTIWLSDYLPLREHDPIEDDIAAPLIEPINNPIYLPVINR
jgi:peptide/nickel transport system substrate-binding protein